MSSRGVSQDPGGLALDWASSLMTGLADVGVTDVIVSPGSRSTPLVLATEREPRLRSHVVIDERVAGFFALGQAKLTGRASALICTSGSALTHYFPAVVEANNAGVPMVILSADRPWDAHHVGAAQTIDQLKVFGDHVRKMFAVGEPTTEVPLRSLQRIAAQAFATSMSPLPGPVHINLPFRKPLEPATVVSMVQHRPEETSRPAYELTTSGAPRVFAPVVAPSPAGVAALVAALLAAKRPMMVFGPAPASRDAKAMLATIAQLFRSTGAVSLLEATSQLRLSASSSIDDRLSDGLLVGFEAYLSDPALSEHAPDLIIEVSGTPASAAYAALSRSLRGAVRFSVADTYRDAESQAHNVIIGDPDATLGTVAAELSTRRRANVGAHHEAYFGLERRAENLVQSDRSDHLTEGAVIRQVLAAVPDDAIIVIGNSSPVRDLDLFAAPSGKDLTVIHQRGACGIDGTVATALGVRSVTQRPVLALMGDVTAQHDVGGLAHLRASGDAAPLCVLVIDNQGGRIFEQLPIADRISSREAFERLYATPTNGDGFGRIVQRRSELDAALKGGFDRSQTTVITARVPPLEGHASRRGIAAAGRTGAVRPATFGPVCAREEKVQTAPAPVVMLHGFAGQPEMWGPVIDSALLTMPSFRWSVGRLPGHGRAASDDAISFESAIDEMLSTLPAGRSLWVGYSMGARLILGMLSQAPERCQGAVLIGAHPGLDDAERPVRIAWESTHAARLRTDGIDAFRQVWETLPVFASEGSWPAPMFRAQQLARMAHRPQPLAAALEGLGTGSMPSHWAHLKANRVPIAWVTGGLDTKFTELGARAVRSNQPVSRAVVVPDAGHNVALEAPEPVAQVIIKMLRDTAQPASVHEPEASTEDLHYAQ